MNYIITIAREFSSGGRELGRRLADELKIAYYDKEILEGIQEKSSYSKEYISEISEHRPILLPPINYGNSFSIYHDVSFQQTIDIHSLQNKIIKEYANQSSCVIIGRGADYTLREYHPFRIFVYSDDETKMKRCRARDEKASKLTDKQLLKKIHAVDKKRKSFYEYYTGLKWGDKSNYDLLINTSGIDIKEAAVNLAKLIKQISDSKNN